MKCAVCGCTLGKRLTAYEGVDKTRVARLCSGCFENIGRAWEQRDTECFDPLTRAHVSECLCGAAVSSIPVWSEMGLDGGAKWNARVVCSACTAKSPVSASGEKTLAVLGAVDTWNKKQRGDK